MIRSNTNNNLITALYCRLSVEDMRIGESMSIENQRLMLTEFAEQQGFKNIKLYVDDGYSGTNNARPAYVELMNDVYAGLVGTVIVKDQSRLGRDHLETDKLLELVFPSYDVRFIAITDGVDSINGFNDMSTMRNWFNDFYARDTSKKKRAVQRAKGERVYRIGGDEYVILCVDASEKDVQELVERIRQEVAKTPYTCSVGYAMKTDGESIDKLYQLADSMLYVEKQEFYIRSGKNRRK